jgi:hypothetical protein
VIHFAVYSGNEADLNPEVPGTGPLGDILGLAGFAAPVRGNFTRNYEEKKMDPGLNIAFLGI